MGSRDASGIGSGPWSDTWAWNLAIAAVAVAGALLSLVLWRAEPFLAAAGIAWFLGMLRVARAVDRRRRRDSLP